MPESQKYGGLLNAFNTDEFSDFRIICQDRRFAVHKVVISSQSEFFHAACTNTFLETTSQQVELKDDDVHIVERMLHFFYAASYPAILPGPHTDMSLRSELDVHVEMYAIADKYQVAALSVLAKDNYQHVVNGYDDCIAVLRSVPKIYNSTIKTDRGLRDIAVAEVIAKVVNKMEGRQMSSGKRSEVVPLLESVVSDVPGFALDILTKVGKVIRDQVEKATRDQIETAIRERGDCYCECKYYQDCNEQY